jgi:hypothetical protein
MQTQVRKVRTEKFMDIFCGYLNKDYQVFSWDNKEKMKQTSEKFWAGELTLAGGDLNEVLAKVTINTQSFHLLVMDEDGQPLILIKFYGFYPSEETSIRGIQNLERKLNPEHSPRFQLAYFLS